MNAPAEPVVSFEDVSFSYSGTPVLVHASIQIAPMQATCVVGPNGGGKSTFLKLMLGLLKPDSGRVRVLGMAPSEACRQIGYMPQYLHFDPKFPITVLDVALMGRMRPWRIGPYSRQDRDAARDALDQVGLKGLEGRQFNALSGGQRQRVLIARALVTQPKLLVLDEPTANVDMVVEQQLFETLDKLSESMTVIFVSHDLGFVSHFVDSVVCCNRSVHIHPTTAITGEVIQELYGADLKMIRHDHICSAEGHSHEPQPAVEHAHTHTHGAQGHAHAHAHAPTPKDGSDG